MRPHILRAENLAVRVGQDTECRPKQSNASQAPAVWAVCRFVAPALTNQNKNFSFSCWINQTLIVEVWYNTRTCALHWCLIRLPKPNNVVVYLALVKIGTPPFGYTTAVFQHSGYTTTVSHYNWVTRSHLHWPLFSLSLSKWHYPR